MEDDLGGYQRLYSGQGVLSNEGVNPYRENVVPSEPNIGCMDGHPPPSIPIRLVESPLPSEKADGGGDMIVPSTSRAGNCTVKQKTNEVLERRTFVNSIRGYITVNGVRLQDSQMTMREDKVKKTPVRKVKKDDKAKKSVRTTPSVNRISNYFSKKEDDVSGKMTLVKTAIVNYEARTSQLEGGVKEQGDKVINHGRQGMNIDDKETKTTFNTIGTKKIDVKKKIEEFHRISNKNDRCIIGSGRCATHNTKVMRVMVKKRVSVKNIDGSVGWQMCEGTTLTCPAVYQGPDTGSCNDLSDI